MHVNLIGRLVTLAARLITLVALAMLMALAILGGLLHGVLIRPLIEPAVRIAPGDPHAGKIGLKGGDCHKNAQVKSREGLPKCQRATNLRRYGQKARTIEITKCCCRWEGDRGCDGGWFDGSRIR